MGVSEPRDDFFSAPIRETFYVRISKKTGGKSRWEKFREFCRGFVRFFLEVLKHRKHNVVSTEMSTPWFLFFRFYHLSGGDPLKVSKSISINGSILVWTFTLNWYEFIQHDITFDQFVINILVIELSNILKKKIFYTKTHFKSIKMILKIDFNSYLRSRIMTN